MRSTIPLTLLVLGLVAAGCITPAADTVDPAELLQGDPTSIITSVFEFDHDHTDPALHAAAFNMELVAHLAPEIPGLDAVSFNEIDLAGDLAFVSVGGASGGFAVFDVADPANAQFLHFEPAPRNAACIGDIKAGPIENHVVLGAQCSPAGQSDPVTGIIIYDVTDPTAPKLVSQGARGVNCHMVDTANIGGTSYVYCAATEGPTAWRLVDLPGAPMTPVLVNPNVNHDPTTVRHYPRASAEFGQTSGAMFMALAHDMTTQEDPLTGAPILVASHSYNGVRIIDGASPETGEVLGEWSGQGADDFSWIHTAFAFEHEGKRIVLAITENVVDTPPRMWFIDFTDYANPVLVGSYAIGDQGDSHQLVYSAHNFQVVGDRVYMAAYHGGVWVLDISDLADVQAVGIATPSSDHPYTLKEGSFWGIGNNWVSQVWDVVVKDGYVLASDMASGFYIYHYVEDPAGAPTYTSQG